MKYENITEIIIGCAYKVYNEMGYGFLESVYEKCLVIELEKAKLKFELQKSINVYYDEILVGHFIADIFVEDKIIIELKSVRNLTKQNEVQLVNYLTATGLDIGLLINFGENKIEIKRKFKDKINTRERGQD